MAGLAELNLKPIYRKGRDNIAEAFYLPCMRCATEYVRAVGYFRSSIFILAWPALREFVDRSGKMDVLCSHVLAKEDVGALDEGYEARRDTALATRLRNEVEAMLMSEELREPTRILAALVAQEVIDLKVAVLREDEDAPVRRGIFHDKLGIFRDGTNTVIFKGSMNETWSGLAADGNLESVDVAASWLGERDLERVREEEVAFSALWTNRFPTVSVVPFPDIVREQLCEAADPAWQESLDEILDRAAKAAAARAAPADPRGRTLREHQRAGLESWAMSGRRGILAFVTGGGKTFTAITAIREAVTKHRDTVVVVVPDRVLFEQWYDELTETLADLDLRILKVGAGSTRWRDSLGMWSAERSADDAARLVLATAQTAATPDFIGRLRGGAHLMLVADEVHRLGAPQRRTLLEPQLFGARLGLSATPERAGDPEGTSLLLDYFSGVLEPRYTLADAVRDRVLCPYFYRAHVAELSDDEMAGWRKMTAEIVRLRQMMKQPGADPGLAARLKRRLIGRARIVKQASAKVPLAVSILRNEYKPGQRWIVYCDDSDQLNAVSAGLNGAGVDAVPFHSAMTGDRTETLAWLEHRGGVLVSIKCLDEGVDIPSVTHALILASSKNPREYIQRRGRVLRVADRKALAWVHDVIAVAPQHSADDGEIAGDPILAGELARAIEFAQTAANPSAEADLQTIARNSNLHWRGLLTEGMEDEDD